MLVDWILDAEVSARIGVVYGGTLTVQNHPSQRLPQTPLGHSCVHYETAHLEGPGEQLSMAPRIWANWGVVVQGKGPR